MQYVSTGHRKVDHSRPDSVILYDYYKFDRFGCLSANRIEERIWFLRNHSLSLNNHKIPELLFVLTTENIHCAKHN